MPPEIAEKLSAQLVKVLNRPDLRARLVAAGMEPVPMAPAPFAAFVKQQLDIWGQKVKAAGIQPE